MAKEWVEFEWENGSSVVLECEQDEDLGEDEIADSGEGRKIRKASEKFNTVAKRIRPAAQVVLNALKGLDTPKEVVLGFGLKFSASAGVVVASADSEVNFKVSVKWEKPNES